MLFDFFQNNLKLNKIITMLDLGGCGLPKNLNGFRTTHTCELCGFEPKTKNKYREKQDHLVMKHFKERIDKIFPHCRPYTCPSEDCVFTGKDKQVSISSNILHATFLYECVWRSFSLITVWLCNFW